MVSRPFSGSPCATPVSTPANSTRAGRPRRASLSVFKTSSPASQPQSKGRQPCGGAGSCALTKYPPRRQSIHDPEGSQQSTCPRANAVPDVCGRKHTNTLAAGLDREAGVGWREPGRVDLHAVGQPPARDRQLHAPSGAPKPRSARALARPGAERPLGPGPPPARSNGSRAPARRCPRANCRAGT